MAAPTVVPSSDPRHPAPGARAPADVAPQPSRPVLVGRFVSFVLGLLTVFYGLLLMSVRPVALATLALMAGLGFIAVGVTHLGLASGASARWRWLSYLGGLAGIAAGVAAFAWPGRTLLTLAVITSWALVVNGMVRIVASVGSRERELWWLGLVFGLGELILGLWAIGSPVRQVLLMVNLIGIYFVITGIDSMVGALADRPPRAPEGSSHA